MPARTFVSASNPLITCALGANNFAFGPGTMAAIVRRSSDAAQHFIIHAGPNSGTTRFSLGISLANVPFLRCGATDLAGPTTTVLAADGWCLIAATKATGTVAATIYIYKYGTGVLTTETSSATGANSTAATTATYIGANATGSTEINGDIAVCASWNVVLTQAQILSLAFGLNSWWCQQPRSLYVLDQDATTQALPDMSGNGGNQTASTGTTISTSSVPTFSYGFDEIEADTVAVTGTPYTQSLAGTLTSSGALKKAAAQNKAGTLTSAGALAKAVTQGKAGTLTSSGLLRKAVAQNKAGTFTSSGALAQARGYFRTLTGTLTSAGALTKAVAQNKAGTLTSSGLLTKAVAQTKTGTLTSSGSLVKAVGKFLAGALTSSGGLSNLVTTPPYVAPTIVVSPSVPVQQQSRF